MTVKAAQYKHSWEGLCIINKYILFFVILSNKATLYIQARAQKHLMATFGGIYAHEQSVLPLYETEWILCISGSENAQEAGPSCKLPTSLFIEHYPSPPLSIA